ncbi:MULTISPECIES: hypothetical protein [unclassified Rhodococcus (in: high G+C Gram-positive bacteria)]|uniref:hypothetical protein n=1 Tax=unclassified Rhodococcus (in: high G+C Gram-positive bacteria) TaxID=192944 RepID=UPI0012E36725|nr:MULTISPECIES: hypothetical protein [unclassified Rhodococcus (in: high G+C Gram-positive bacteria)]
MSDPTHDPYARDSIGRLRGAPIEPIEEYEASGRFRCDPYAPPDPERVDALLTRLGLEGGRNFDPHRSNPIVEQWEMHQRFAESFSPGHDRLAHPATGTQTLGHHMAFMQVGQRRTGGPKRSSISAQNDDPLDVRAVLVGCDSEGWLQTEVNSYEEVRRIVLEQLSPKLRRDSWCGFCNKKKIRLADLRFLLQGHSYWIFATPACLGCQTKLCTNAREIDVDLTWIAHPSVGDQ